MRYEVGDRIPTNGIILLDKNRDHPFFTTITGTKCSRMDQVKFVEDGL